MMSSAPRRNSISCAAMCANFGSGFQARPGDAVHRERPLVDIALGVQVVVKVSPGRAAAQQLHAPDLDDAVVLRGLKTGGFGIENDLAHPVIPP